MIEYAELFQPDNVQTMTLFSHLPPDLQVFICTGYTNLHKAIDGLSAIVEDEYGLNPCSKSFYCFCGRKTDRIRILFYDGDSYLLLQRRTEKIRHQWPRTTGEMWKLSLLGFYKLMKGERLQDGDVLMVFKKL